MMLENLTPWAKTSLFARLSGLALLLLLTLTACQPARPTATDRLPVAASIPPIADFVAQVGGERVEVLTLVEPGVSPHTYEPTPAQMRWLSHARLLFLNGVGLEYWAEKAIAAANNPDLQVVVLSEGLPVLDDEHHDEDHAAGNPHLWLSPRLAMVYVERIRDALIVTDPAGEPTYRANATRYLQKLQALDEEIRRTVATFSTRQVVVFHPAWAYFFADYGLEIAAVVEPSPGKEPTPQDTAEVVETLRKAHARALFAEPQLSPQVAEAIAAEAGVQVLFLDPLGGVPGRETYLDLMRYNLAQLAKGLR